MNTAHSLPAPAEPMTISAPHSEVNTVLFERCAEIAQRVRTNLYILKDADGNVRIELEAGTHGQLDAIIDYGDPVPYDEEIEMMAVKAFVELETSGSHTVRWTSRGVRAYLNADWTRRYTGRTNGAPPAEFNSADHRPWYLKPVPDAPKSKKTSGGIGAWKGFRHPMQPRPCTPMSSPDPWDDDELDAVGA